MAKFIAVESLGVTEFINSEDMVKLKNRRDNFKAKPRRDKTGKIIEYTEDDIRKILGVKVGGNAASDIFGDVEVEVENADDIFGNNIVDEEEDN